MRLSTTKATVNQVNNPPVSVRLDNKQVANNAGGFCYQVDDFDFFKRSIIISPSDNYYTTEQHQTVEYLKLLKKVVSNSQLRYKAYQYLVKCSLGGLAPKQDSLLFAYSYFVLNVTRELDSKLYEAISSDFNKIIRTGTHLFTFFYCVKVLNDGKIPHRANKLIASWYKDPEKSVDQLAYQVSKYQSRAVTEKGEKISHRDLLRLSHPFDVDKNAIFRWVTSDNLGERTVAPKYKTSNNNDRHYESVFEKLPQYLKDVDTLKSTTDLNLAIELIQKNRFPHEVVPSTLASDPKVMKALIPHMNYEALLRSLVKIDNRDLLDDKETFSIITSKLLDTNAIKNSRIHPLKIFLALRATKSLRNTKLTDTLDEAFYSSFKYIEPTGKRYLIGLDVSGSMTGLGLNNNTVSYIEAALVMSLGILASEKDVTIKGFSDTLVDLDLSPRRRLDDNLKIVSRLPFDYTNPSLLVRDALNKKKEYDVFIVITDNEVNAGEHYSNVLDKYRKAVNPKAKMVISAVAMNKFSLARPDDPYSIDLAGFSAALPAEIQAFAKL